MYVSVDVVAVVGVGVCMYACVYVCDGGGWCEYACVCVWLMCV